MGERKKGSLFKQGLYQRTYRDKQLLQKQLSLLRNKT